MLESNDLTVQSISLCLTWHFLTIVALHLGKIENYQSGFSLHQDWVHMDKYHHNGIHVIMTLGPQEF